MPRCIDADKLTEYFFRPYSNEETYSNIDLRNIIAKAPTVDAEPVVRCKNCKHYWKNNPSDDVPVCLATPKDDSFCSEGERRENAD